MYSHALIRVAGIALAGLSLAAIPATTAAAPTHARSLHVQARLTVTGGAPPNCQAGICAINNHGHGNMIHFGNVTFNTRITADGNNPPCGAGSQWVRATRTIHTAKGNLVLHEAGLQCSQPGGPRVDLVWALDGADSTGIFAGAHGRGSDVAYPVQNTAAPRGRITVAP